MPIKVITPPAGSFISTAMALTHMGVLPEEADLVDFYLAAAQAYVENYTGRVMLDTEFELYMSNWDLTEGRILEINRSPLGSVVSVQYYAEGNPPDSPTTYSTSEYEVDTTSIPGRIIFKTLDLPALQDRYDAVKIRFRAGVVGDETQVDKILKLAALQLAHHWYDNKLPIGSNLMNAKIPYSMEAMLFNRKVRSLKIV